jgi:glyoxylase-like metal-dependent hydrolase (beta-lactamase superfamily II)
MIDTSPANKWRILEKRLSALNITHLDCLILTHTHFDHVGNMLKIKNRYNPAVIVHRKEALYITKGESVIPKGTNAFTRFLVNRVAPKIRSGFTFESCQYDILVDSIYDLKDFGFNATVMHTPGHSAGSMSVIVDNEIAIVGDAMFGVFKGSVYPPFADDPKQMIHSWGKLLATSCRFFLPAHGTSNSRALLKREYDKRK